MTSNASPEPASPAVPVGGERNTAAGPPPGRAPATACALAGVELLYRVSAELNASLELEDVLARTLDHVTEALGASGGSLLLADPRSGRLGRAAIARRMRQPERLQMLGLLQTGRGLGGWVAEQRQGALVADVEEDARWLWSPGRPHDTRSAICVPLVFGTRLLGVLTLTHPQPGHFHPEDLRLLGAIANAVAVALHNAAQHRAAQAARKRAELEARRLAAVIANLPDGLVMLDARLRPTVVNAAAGRLLRIPGAPGAPLPRLLAEGALPLEGDDRERALTLLAGAGRQREARRAEVTTAPGERHLELLLAPIRGDRRRTLGSILVARDRTLERQAERFKDQLIADVSHEIQTPLASVRASAEMLLDDAGDTAPELRQRLLGIIAGESEELSRLVTNMLDLSRLDGGHWVPRVAPVDLRRIAVDVATALAVPAELAGVAVLPGDSSRPCLAVADEQMVDIVLRNLVGNGIKYAGRGRTVRVAGARDAQWAELTVADDGPGIPRQALPHIFTRFYRARSTTEGRVKGAGLGLALARALVEAQGGSITAASEPGQGAVFTVRLPAASLAEAVGDPPRGMEALP